MKENEFTYLEEERMKLLISALSKNLELSVEERIEAHENALELINDLSNAFKDLSARSKEAS